MHGWRCAARKLRHRSATSVGIGISIPTLGGRACDDSPRHNISGLVHSSDFGIGGQAGDRKVDEGFGWRSQLRIWSVGLARYGWRWDGGLSVTAGVF